jgi:hypothetical protein
MHATHLDQPYDVSSSRLAATEDQSLWTPASPSLALRASSDGDGPRINVHQTERVISSLVGGFLLARALTRRSREGTLFGLLGSALVYRGVSGHCQLYQAFGLSTAT